MPLYEYKCDSCSHEFSDVLKVDDRLRPCEEPCPNCAAQGRVERVIGAPRIVAGVGEVYSKTPDVFRDRLKEIHKQSGKHSKINV
jgi:putative FmdB family regulatory protein